MIRVEELLVLVQFGRLVERHQLHLLISLPSKSTATPITTGALSATTQLWRYTKKPKLRDWEM